MLFRSLFIVLPMLVENTKELFKRHKVHSKEVDSTANVVIPVSYNFPNLGFVGKEPKSNAHPGANDEKKEIIPGKR